MSPATLSDTLYPVRVQCVPPHPWTKRHRAGRIWQKGDTVTQVTEAQLKSLREDATHFMVSLLSPEEFAKYEAETAHPDPVEVRQGRTLDAHEVRIVALEDALGAANQKLDTLLGLLSAKVAPGDGSTPPESSPAATEVEAPKRGRKPQE